MGDIVLLLIGMAIGFGAVGVYFYARYRPFAAPAAPLDVERLARALVSVLPWSDDAWVTDQAAAIAAAYAEEGL